MPFAADRTLIAGHTLRILLPASIAGPRWGWWNWEDDVCQETSHWRV